jgi:D-alanine-D-alanine ligase
MAAREPQGDLRGRRIGICYDLRAEYIARGVPAEEVAEFDSPATIDAIAGALQQHGCQVDRIGSLHSLLPRLVAGERWDLVFNIAEGRHGFGREAQVPAVLDAFAIPYTFCEPLAAAVTLHKATAKHVLRDAGLPTAPFFVVSELDEVARCPLPFPVLGKPVAEGTSKGIGADAVARDAVQLRSLCQRLLTAHRQPVLVEAFLPGRELTVGVVGTGAAAATVGALEITLLAGADADVCTFRNKEDCERLVSYSLPTDEHTRAAERIALAAWRTLGCRDGGRVDLRADASGHWQILELNPLPGLHPTHSDLPILWSLGGRRYENLIGAIAQSALQRVPTR